MVVAGLVGGGGGGLTPLIFAAREGDSESAKALLDAGAQVNQQSEYGWSPLLTAVNNRNYQLAKLLLDRGADVNLANKGLWTPLYLATDNRNIEGGDYPVPKADMDHLEFIRLLLEKGANPNAQLKLRPPYRMVSQDRLADPSIDYGATPLLRAAKAADVEAMKVLLDAGALVDLQNVYGHTPLIVVAGATRGRATPTRGGNYTEAQAIDAVKLLLAAGADVNASGFKGPTTERGETLRCTGCWPPVDFPRLRDHSGQ